MAFLQQPITYRRIVTPLMMKRELPELQTVEQRMMLILLTVVFCILAMLTMLARQIGQNMASDGAQAAINLVNDAQVPVVGSINRGVGEATGISPLFTPEVRYWEAEIVRWAAAFEVDPNMVATVMQIESCGWPSAVSRAGASGLFQVMPFHFASGENHFDPDTNARRGVAYLAERLVQTDGDVGLAFAGYNGGHVAAAGNWDSWANETQRYYIWSTGIYGEVSAGMSESPTLQRWLSAGGASLCQQASTQLGLN